MKPKNLQQTCSLRMTGRRKQRTNDQQKWFDSLYENSLSWKNKKPGKDDEKSCVDKHH